MIYQGGLIYHCTHITVPGSQYISESEYNAACTAGMALEKSTTLNNEVMNKYPNAVPEQAPIIIVDIK